MTLRRTLHLIGTDIERYAAVNGLGLTFLRRFSILLLPCVAAIAIHRFSHWFHVNGHHFLSRILWTLNIVVFSLEILPYTEIGPSFYMPHPAGVALCARIGSNVTAYAQCGVGGRQDKDIGAGNAIPIVEDNVVLGARCTVLGTVRVGKDAIIGPTAVVFTNVPAGAVVKARPSRISRAAEPEPEIEIVSAIDKEGA